MRLQLDPLSPSGVSVLPEPQRVAARGGYAGSPDITRVLQPGTNVTFTGNGTQQSPYVVNSSGTGGSGTPGGSNTQVQYNNAGAFGGISGQTTDGTKTTFAGGSIILAGASTGTASVQYASTALSGGTFTFPGINSTQTVAVLGIAQTFSADTTFSSINGNFGSSTVSSTYQLGYGATLSGQTKTLRIGTGGVSGSTTAINIGSAFGTTVTFNNLGSGLLNVTSGVLGLATANTDYQSPITLTTTGSSGAATLISNTLNIPNYSTGGGSGMTRSIVAFSVATNAGSTAVTDYVYIGTGTNTLTLPTAVSNTNAYGIKNSGTGIITVATTSTQTIDGNANITLTPSQFITVYSDNANWIIGA